eukprot:901078_1
MKWIETEYKQMNKYYEDVLSTMTAIKTSKMRMKQRQNVLKKRIKWVLQNCDIHHIPTISSMHTHCDDRLYLSPYSMPLPYSRSYDQNTKAKKLTILDKTRSAEYNAQHRFGFGLSQSESVRTPTVGYGFCIVMSKRRKM